MTRPGRDGSRLFMEQVPGALRLAGWLLLVLFLVFMDMRQHWLVRARAETGVLLDPVFALLSLPERLGRQASGWLVDQQALNETRDRLQRENARLHSQVHQLKGMLNDQRVIQDLLQPLYKAGKEIHMARVVQLNVHPFTTEVLVNLGMEDGIVAGMAALDASGVAGQVVTVLPHHAWVMLISDPDHALPVQIRRTGVRSILVGMGRPDELIAINLPLSADVKTGDVLETSGIGGRFPPHYPVAVVEDVERVSGEQFATVHARPLARLDRLQFLALGHWPEVP